MILGEPGRLVWVADFGRTQVAKMRLDAGFARAPLLGGLDAWAVAGYPAELNDPQ
jgi:hypothetical protein